MEKDFRLLNLKSLFDLKLIYMRYIVVVIIFILSCSTNKNIVLNDNFEVYIGDSLDIKKNKKYYFVVGEITGVKKKKHFDLIASKSAKFFLNNIYINQESIREELKGISNLDNNILKKVEVFHLKDSIVYSELIYEKGY